MQNDHVALVVLLNSAIFANSVLVVPWSKRFSLLGDSDMTVSIPKGSLSVSYLPQRQEIDTNAPPSNPQFIGRNQAMADIIELLLKPEVFVSICVSLNSGSGKLCSHPWSGWNRQDRVDKGGCVVDDTKRPLPDSVLGRGLSRNRSDAPPVLSVSAGNGRYSETDGGLPANGQ